MNSLNQAPGGEAAWARAFSEGLRGSREDASGALESFFEKAGSLDPVAAAAALGRAGRLPLDELAVIIFGLTRNVSPGVDDATFKNISGAKVLTWAAALIGACIASDALGELDINNSGHADSGKSTLGRNLTLLLFISSNEGRVDVEAAQTMAAAMKARGLNLKQLEQWVAASGSVGGELHGFLSEAGQAALASWSKSELENGLLSGGVRKRAAL